MTVPVTGGGWDAEQGLAGIAADPDFLNNRFVYVYYTATSGTECRIARLQEAGGIGTNFTVLTAPGALPSQLYHNGGTMALARSTVASTWRPATGSAAATPSTCRTGSARCCASRRRAPTAAPSLGIPQDNPFPGSAIFVGDRNQLGSLVSVLYQTENGGALRDEINRIVAGGNYGWPTFEGYETTPNPNFVDPSNTRT